MIRLSKPALLEAMVTAFQARDNFGQPLYSGHTFSNDKLIYIKQGIGVKSGGSTTQQQNWND